jgi:hypothetical protein
MRAVTEQHNCKLDDFQITDQYIEYMERQTKNRQGDEGNKKKRARKYNNKIWRTDGGERDPYRAFIEYVHHRPKDENVPSNFYLTPVENPRSDIWYKAAPVGKNTLSILMKNIASTAEMTGKFTNTSGRKTSIQSLRDEFTPLEIAELTGHANPESISSYSHNPLEKQRRISNKLSGFTPVATATTKTSSSTSSSIQPSFALEMQPSTAMNPAANSMQPGERSSCLAGAVNGLFSGSTFNNSSINLSIHLQSNVQ